MNTKLTYTQKGDYFVPNIACKAQVEEVIRAELIYN